MSKTAYQWSVTHRLNDAMLSSDSSSLRNVASGPDGSTWKSHTELKFNFMIFDPNFGRDIKHSRVINMLQKKKKINPGQYLKIWFQEKQNTFNLHHWMETVNINTYTIKRHV